jgi:hypothetical protein
MTYQIAIGSHIQKEEGLLLEKRIEIGPRAHRGGEEVHGGIGIGTGTRSVNEIRTRSEIGMILLVEMSQK